MRPFVYERATSPEDAVRAARGKVTANLPPVQAPGQFIAGGTNMTDYMKLDVMRPEILVDVNGIDRNRYGRIEEFDGGIRFGHLVRMAEAEEHPAVKAKYPVIAQSLQLAASQQIRNMATLGGNVLQRTRCDYFREATWACNKREPGSGCSAMDGINRRHALLGTSDQCIASYPGDFAQALIALDALVETQGPKGNRKIRFADLHVEPGNTPNVETVLEPGELITFITVPSGAWTRRSMYLKIRDRQSYEFAVTSTAVALDLDGDTVRDVRIALGGVATRPWRSREAEDALKGKPLTPETASAAADAAFAGAKPRKYNAFKIPLGKETVIRALLETKNMEA
ncbi:xanthine dehydrogenase YagS FAD-binding subunit [Faunimonas pinastri]|uniref:Xanthine dehydrogenase YagS FAD-binding subunit n=1 Tax=Faunimonas pinastri TaxID=1855383 RepID=A0A1H9A3X1_9HYPH|nr:xanthine dehydrogenase family protein subunit M [Faunimonas pinastri]SEP71211.1 xanthine dehydrogenase YagS FAD-binding subunit [Faunimonas pinastri]